MKYLAYAVNNQGCHTTVGSFNSLSLAVKACRLSLGKGWMVEIKKGQDNVVKSWTIRK